MLDTNNKKRERTDTNTNTNTISYPPEEYILTIPAVLIGEPLTSLTLSTFHREQKQKEIINPLFPLMSEIFCDKNNVNTIEQPPNKKPRKDDNQTYQICQTCQIYNSMEEVD
jgi:hypothetical protein